jgi:NAD(P)-dependent dehydrogenase (short-subunit alcohol dehydrogenase family)
VEPGTVAGMARTYVVTGSASGIGRATCELLASEGHRVIDVDRHSASVTADLATPEGRLAMVAAVTDAVGGEGAVDAVVANAGVSDPAELCVQVNFFGAVATLEGLRPLLARSDAPRAVATASSSVLTGADPTLLDACLAGDEAAALAAAAPVGLLSYPTTKRAIARWVRREAPTDAWAGAGIGLNAVAPGVVLTPMAQPLFDDEAMRELMDSAVPMPYQGYAEPAHVARLIAFLASGDTCRITGQVVFIDGGADTVLRGDDIWS